MSDHLSAVLQEIESQQRAALERLFTLIRIPSISTDPAYKEQCRVAASTYAHWLSDIGFTASVRETEGHPIVVGHYQPKHFKSKARVLFYGHYDVQPPDPLPKWISPPFEPHLTDDPENGTIIRGRGAQDNKGQLSTFLEASRAWIAVTGDLPISVTVLIEGEEECGSPSLPGFIKHAAAELAADYAIACDTIQWNKNTPAIITTLRGLTSSELIVKGANRELHSGLFGGPVINPIKVLTKILGDLFNDGNRIQIPGFYDNVRDLDKEQKMQWAKLAFDPHKFLGNLGLKESAGETEYSVLEQIWSRPTAEINGITGGYQGPGEKTVIPSQASAKITFRMAPGQDPATILRGWHHFVDARLPDDCTAEYLNEHGTPAVVFDKSAPYMIIASRCLEEEWGTAPVLAGIGGSIPIVHAFRDLLGMNSLLVGFGCDDDGMHSPNEKYNLRSFNKGMRSWARILEALGR
jgi:acetylornithine deacetylase/succinyl-diaminopimelate desuccinylase-like protein